jgi:hypothetical protein
MTPDVLDDLAEQIAAQPDPGSEAVELMRRRLLAAMEAEIGSSSRRVRHAGGGGGHLSGVPERRRFVLSVVVIVVLLIAVFVVPLPQLFHFGPGSHATSTTLPSAKSPITPVSVAQLLAGHWSEMAPGPLVSDLDGAVVAWTGRELIVWGGVDGSALHGFSFSNAGAAYDPASNTWQTLADSPLSPRAFSSAVWTGTELVIFGGETFLADMLGPKLTSTAAAYDPSTNTWRMLPQAPLSPREMALAVWTGSTVLVLGGVNAAWNPLSDGAAFDPTTDTWRHVAQPVPPKGHQLSWQVAVKAGDEVLAFSDWFKTRALGGGRFAYPGGSDLFAYGLSTRRWTLEPARPNSVPVPDEALWTGRVLVVRGLLQSYGRSPFPPAAQVTGLYDPSTNAWAPVGADPLAKAEDVYSAWTGDALFSFSPASDNGPTPPGATSLYDAATGRWSRLKTAPVGCDDDATPIWSGRQILVSCPSENVTGLLYTPARPRH